MKRIVLTGGPGAGKTVIGRIVAQVHGPQRFVAVPEAATAVFTQLDTRWDRLSPQGRRDVQRRIFALQLQQEDEMAQAYPDKSLLLDRGTADGAAYWPDGPADYWHTLQTTLAQQHARYDLVIWLETCAALPGLYDADSSNPKRHESPAAAMALGQRLHDLWREHPCFFEVRACINLQDKIAAVARILDEHA